MILEILKYDFFQNGIAAAILASVVCGIMGTLIIEKKLVMMSGGIAHTAYGGVGLGYLLGIEPILGAVVFSVLAALGIGYINRKGGVYTDIIIALFWSLGMALGIFFIGLMPGYPPDMSTYLFGNILTVTRSDLIIMAVLAIVIVSVISIFWQDFKAWLFDSYFSRIMGLKTISMEYGLLILIALTVVVLIRVAGIILVIALLTAPSGTASLLSQKLSTRIWLSIVIGLFGSISGLFISYFLNIASGATIIMFSVLIYGLVYAFKHLKHR